MEKNTGARRECRGREPAEGLPRCEGCDRLLADPSEQVRSGRRTMCLDCYERLIDPFPKRCHAGLLI